MAVSVNTKEKPYVFMMTLLTRMSPTLLPTEPTIQPATDTAEGDGGSLGPVEDEDDMADTRAGTRDRGKLRGGWQARGSRQC